MAYEVNFGTMRAAASRPVARKTGRFRIAVLGDFSARANSGKLDTGATLAGRKPHKADSDNLDPTLKRFGVKFRLPLGANSGVVELTVNSMDDLHPDQLYKSLPIFSELSGLRQRLKTPSTFAKAAKEVQAWAGVQIPRVRRTRARSAAIPAHGKLSDFARLVGAPTAPARAAVSVAEMLKQLVGPYVVPAKDPRQDQLVATVDSALAATMRSVLHHPDFQSFEALWRSVDLLVRRLETDEHLQIVLYDVTAEEIAADLSKADALENSGLHKLLVEQPALDAARPFAVVIGNYLLRADAASCGIARAPRQNRGTDPDRVHCRNRHELPRDEASRLASTDPRVLGRAGRNARGCLYGTRCSSIHVAHALWRGHGSD
jgi:type VI secretion system protein ImpC